MNKVTQKVVTDHWSSSVSYKGKRQEGSMLTIGPKKIRGHKYTEDPVPVFIFWPSTVNSAGRDQLRRPGADKKNLILYQIMVGQAHNQRRGIGGGWHFATLKKKSANWRNYARLVPLAKGMQHQRMLCLPQWSSEPYSLVQLVLKDPIYQGHVQLFRKTVLPQVVKTHGKPIAFNTEPTVDNIRWFNWRVWSSV